jgi:hypothetical protein
MHAIATLVVLRMDARSWQPTPQLKFLDFTQLVCRGLELESRVAGFVLLDGNVKPLFTQHFPLFETNLFLFAFYN